MPQSPSYPAQCHLLHQMINWDHVSSRLKRYPAIGRAFPMETLMKHCKSPPYYCHYMSWRLGAWSDESVLRRLEELLCCAEALPHWESEQNLLAMAEFPVFWSLFWQLQVAEYLCEVGTDVCWGKSGPDLSAQVGGKLWYVECYTPRKSFGLLRFIEELLLKLDPNIRIDYDLCLPFQLPRTHPEQSKFLDKIANRFLDPSYLAQAKEDVLTESPVVLYKDSGSSLYIYVKGVDDNAYIPGIVPELTGDPRSYVECILKEAVDAKKCSNDLRNHHPNLLAINYLLSNDVQLATSLPKRVQCPILPRIGPNIDVLAVSLAGINERLTREKLKVKIQSEGVEYSSLNQIVSGAQMPN